MARHLLLLVFLCLLWAPSFGTSEETKGTCKHALTSMAVISCQESQQFPTPSCCDALLYAVDMRPEFAPDKGLCCLCRFATTRDIPYDILSVYRICGGKDASLVGQWPMPTPWRGDCSGPCQERSTLAPPPPSGSRDADKKAEPAENGQGSPPTAGIVVGVVVGAVAVVILFGCCLYNKRRGGGKAHQSPRPSDDESSQGSVEMTDREAYPSSRHLM